MQVAHPLKPIHPRAPQEAGENCAECASQGVSEEQRRFATGFGGDHIEGCTRQAMGVLGEPELILLCRGEEPFEEVCTKPSLNAATHHTDLRQKIPNVSAFEWSGDNEDHWSLALLRALVGPQPGGG